MKHIPRIILQDPQLMPFKDTWVGRLRRACHKEKELALGRDSLADMAQGHRFYGLHREEDHWVYRDWAPHASKIYLLGDFSAWKADERYALVSLGDGKWELRISQKLLKHGDQYKLHMCWEGGSEDRVPAWARRVVQDPHSLVFNAQVWDPPRPHSWKNRDFRPKSESLFVYEAHPGMATEDYRTGTWEEFRMQVLPRIEKAGYNAIQLMAVQEHPYYGSFGYHVSSFFAPSSRFGTPEELKALIDDAHGRGMRVIMDLVHSHAVKNEVEGISRYDGSTYQFFHGGPRGDHQAWDSRCFDYGKDQVLHFLLSNCRYWLEEFCFDGFRFDGVTSMIYLDHGLGSHFTSYAQYFNLNQDEDALVYLYLANKLIHEWKPEAVTIAEEMSGMPGLAASQTEGGTGFDYRLAMGVPDYWIRTIKERKVEFWHVGDMFYELTNKRPDEKTIHYAESHDQALVGDKTIIFWLMDKDMYTDMHVDSQKLTVDNGVALHKMIRLVTLATAGNGYLNFIGNEFGHPEWIDFPGAHNNWSHHYARRQWSLCDDEALRYGFLAAFDRQMIHLFRKNNILEHSIGLALLQHVEDQVLVFDRGRYLFVFNFSPFRSYTDYGIPAPEGQYKVVLNTDAGALGGFGRLDEALVYPTQGKKNNDQLSLYIPSLSAFVLKRQGRR